MGAVPPLASVYTFSLTSVRIISAELEDVHGMNDPTQGHCAGYDSKESWRLKKWISI